MSDITMPQLGETVTEGTITKWHKQVGDQVKEDEILFEVSTDKVDSEVPSPVGGYLAEIIVPEGETVDVGARLAVISTEAPSSDGGKGDPAPAEASAETQEKAEEVREEAEEQGSPPPSAPPEAPAAPAPSPSAAEAPPPPQPAPPAPEAPAGQPGGNGSGLVLSPVVRRLLTEHNLDPATINGTGAGGRITREDVLAVIDQGGGGGGGGEAGGEAGGGGGAVATKAPPAAAAPAPTAAPAAPVVPAPAARAAAPAIQAGPRDEIIPFSNIRRRTAEHMVRSKHTSAHTIVAMEVDYAGVDRVRRTVKDQFRAEEGISLTYLPFISRAVVDAIARYPQLNSSVGDDQLIVHHQVNIGIAVDLDLEGLIVPVIHDADGKRLRVLARETADLASRARARKLSADDIAGGTFTLTNAGPYGTLFTVPVINQPQVAILATDGVRKRPVVVEAVDGSDAIVIHPVGNLVLAFDHRAFDGAYASAFMALVKEIIETRDWSQEL